MHAYWDHTLAADAYCYTLLPQAVVRIAAHALAAAPWAMQLACHTLPAVLPMLAATRRLSVCGWH